ALAELKAPAQIVVTKRVRTADCGVDRRQMHLAAEDPANPCKQEDHRETCDEAAHVEALKICADGQETGEYEISDDEAYERRPFGVRGAGNPQQLAPLESADRVGPLPGPRPRHPADQIDARERDEARRINCEP